MENFEQLLDRLPNHINGKHIHIYRWLDGCGWSIDCEGIHAESAGTFTDVVRSFLSLIHKFEYTYVAEHRGCGIMLKQSTKIETNEYFY